jgi:outer membrane lipoprotein carrier protein
MSYFVLLVLFLGALFAPPRLSAAPPEEKGLSDLVDGVQRTFEHMKDLSADFVQVFQDSLNRKRQESGHLYLMRPRMMRWEYKSPEEKLFVSDGKTVYFYVPADHQVTKEPVKQSFDDRIPLMFLLGQSNLRNEFTRFELLNAKPFFEGTRVIRMYPKRKTDFGEILMEVDPGNYLIRRLVLAHMDGSRSEFIFSDIHTNAGLRTSLFDFKLPPGVEVVQGLGQ